MTKLILSTRNMGEYLCLHSFKAKHHVLSLLLIASSLVCRDFGTHFIRARRIFINSLFLRAPLNFSLVYLYEYMCACLSCIKRKYICFVVTQRVLKLESSWFLFSKPVVSYPCLFEHLRSYQFSI